MISVLSEIITPTISSLEEWMTLLTKTTLTTSNTMTNAVTTTMIIIQPSLNYYNGD